MKNIKRLGILLGILFLTSCTDDIENTLMNDLPSNEEVLKNTKYTIEGLELNNGKKWTANIETTEGVDKMLEIISSINNDSSLKDYHKVSKKLDKVKGRIINKCSMNGKSHDNLHTWLMPLIKKINGLKSSDNIVDASNTFGEINEHVLIYHDFFE